MDTERMIKDAQAGDVKAIVALYALGNRTGDDSLVAVAWGAALVIHSRLISDAMLMRAIMDAETERDKKRCHAESLARIEMWEP